MSESSKNWAWAWGVGLLASFSALVVGQIVLRGSSNDWRVLLYCVALAAFLNGLLFWRLLMRQTPRWPALRGALTGVLIVLATHILGWYLALLYYYFTGSTDSLGEPTANPLLAVPMSVGYGLLSLVFVGWVTVPVGSLLGALWAYLEYRSRSDK